MIIKFNKVNIKIIEMSYKELNLENLILISRTIFEFDHFVFYGTLLGITRNNNLLDNDDDIDFLIDIKFKDEVLKKIKKKIILKLTKRFVINILFN